jgi:hypothetical protein
MEKAKWMLILIVLLGVPLRGQTQQKISGINKKVVGKWWSSDRQSYIEFLANGACSEGAFYGGTWHIEQGKLSAWERGKDFICLSGALTLIAPNTLIRDQGMGGTPIRYYRGLQQPKRPTPCAFCGTWEYIERGYPADVGHKEYVKITKAGDQKFKLIRGFMYQGTIFWTEPMIKNADGIYLRPFNGTLVARFASSNFYATHGTEFAYKITCALKPNSRLLYSVWSSIRGETDKREATKVSN